MLKVLGLIYLHFDMIKLMARNLMTIHLSMNFDFQGVSE